MNLYSAKLERWYYRKKRTNAFELNAHNTTTSHWGPSSNNFHHTSVCFLKLCVYKVGGDHKKN